MTYEEWYSSMLKSQAKHTSKGKIQWNHNTNTISISSSYILHILHAPSLPEVICGASCSLQLSFAGLAGSGRHDFPAVIPLPGLSSERGSRRKKMLSGTMLFSAVENCHSFEAGTSQVRNPASALGTPEISEVTQALCYTLREASRCPCERTYRFGLISNCCPS